MVTLSYVFLISRISVPKKQAKIQPKYGLLQQQINRKMSQILAAPMLRRSYNPEQTQNKLNSFFPHPNRLLADPVIFGQSQKFANSIKQLQSKIEGVENLMKKKITHNGSTIKNTKNQGETHDQTTNEQILLQNKKRTEQTRALRHKELKGVSQAIIKSYENYNMRRSYRLPEPNKYYQQSPSKVVQNLPNLHSAHFISHNPNVNAGVSSFASAASPLSPSRTINKNLHQKSNDEFNSIAAQEDTFMRKSNSNFLKILNDDITCKDFSDQSYLNQANMTKSSSAFQLQSSFSESSDSKQPLSPSSKKSKMNHQFKFGPVLGKGKFGQVYLARHIETGFIVAIKKVSKAKIKQFNMVEQFSKEIKLHSSFDHPKIVKFYGFFEDKEDIYLVLQYMNGGTLFEYLNNAGTLGVKEATDFLRDIIEALMYLHEKSIAHRDIKPENIVISTAGLAKLCDFGWSALVESARTTFCGTLDYASPEIIQHKAYDWSVDIWCIGVLTYELFVGRAPFESGDRNQVMQKIVNVDKTGIPFLEKIPQQARQFIECLLQKDPSERPKITDLLNFPLFTNKTMKTKKSGGLK